LIIWYLGLSGLSGVRPHYRSEKYKLSFLKGSFSLPIITFWGGKSDAMRSIQKRIMAFSALKKPLLGHFRYFTIEFTK
jgi:hypothetical protein